jgi:hypothetical protein
MALGNPNPFPETDCREIAGALQQVSAAVERLSAALKPKKTPKKKAAKGKKR